ncbi:hypothetical protein Bca101_038954 [Brassica carinata]
MQCGFLSRYVFGVTHSFLLGWICENKEFTCSRRSSAEHVEVQIKTMYVFGFSARKQMGLQGITVAEVMICLSRDFLRQKSS